MADFSAQALVQNELTSFASTPVDVPTNALFLPLVPIVVDVVPPVVGNFSPALGGTIAPTQPISFTVTDDSGGFRRIIVHARFADGLEEVVHNGDNFRGLYGNNNSARVLTAGGFAYTVKRGGGWPQGGPVAINVFAIDQSGNEAA